MINHPHKGYRPGLLSVLAAGSLVTCGLATAGGLKGQVLGAGEPGAPSTAPPGAARAAAGAGRSPPPPGGAGMSGW